MPWTRLSPADCLLLAIALHRSARAGREAALMPSQLELFGRESVG